jgi:dermatan/chondrotin sulfate uronyl 2-O-sulfotransferase UST
MLPLSPDICSRCAPEGPRAVRAVIFNRVPKCGSTTLEHIVRNQSRVCGYQFHRSFDFINSSIAPDEQREFVEFVTGLARRRRLVYDRHLHFVDFAQFGAPQPQYINLIRDPVQMQVSAFYFWRDCACRTHKPFCRAAWQPTNSSGFCLLDIDAIYAGVAPRPVIGVMTRYLCGHDPICLVADPASASARQAALKLALHNLHHRYLWVGVLERLEDSLRLLMQLLPGYFWGLPVAEASTAHVRPEGSSTYSYAQPQSSTLAKLAQENGNDLAIYRHATQLLDCRLRSCGSEAPPGEAFGCAAAEVGSRFHGMRERGTLRTIANAAANRLLDSGRARGRRTGR